MIYLYNIKGEHKPGLWKWMDLSLGIFKNEYAHDKMATRLKQYKYITTAPPEVWRHLT